VSARRRWGTRFGAGLLAAALLAAPAHAQNKTGTAFGQFLLIEPGARISSFGNAGASLAAGLDGAYYNAASPATLDRYEAVFSRADWLAGITLNHLAFGVPIGRWGVGFATLTSMSSGEMDVRTVASPLGTGERFSVTDLALGFGVAKQVTDRFSAGAQVHWIQESIWHDNANTGTVSFGTLYRTSENGFRIGSSLSYFGTSGRFDGRDLRVTFDVDPTRNGDNGQVPSELLTDRFDVPVLFRVGVGQTFTPGRDARLDVALDALHPSTSDESVNLGLELTLRRAWAVRLGWQDAFLPDAETGPTAGLGVSGRLDAYGYRVDYGWADFGRLGDVHRLSFGITFGGEEE